MNQNTVLLVEQRENLREMISFSLESEFNLSVIRARNVREAINFLSMNSNVFAVICDGNEDDGDPYDLFTKAVDGNKDLIFVHTDADKVGEWSSYKGIGLAGKVKRAEVIEKLISTLRLLFLIDESSPVEEFTPVSLTSLKYFEGLHEDIYLKLKTGRLLKIFSAEHSFSIEDVQRFQLKGISHFYFNRQALRWVRNMIDQGIFLLLASPQATLVLPEHQEKEEQIINRIDIQQFSRPFALEREFIKVIHGKSEELLKRFREVKQFKDFMKSLSIQRDETLYIKNRMGLAANISCSLLRQLEWGSDAAYDKMIYVCMAHDLALFKNANLARFELQLELEVQSGFSSEDVELFKQHPIMAEKIIAADSKAPQEAGLIVRQHHELPDRKGFPDSIQVQRVTPFAAVLAVSISLAQFILDNPDWSYPLFEKKYGTRYRGGIFTKVMLALRSLFGVKSII